WIVRPPGADAESVKEGKKWPAVLLIHGGPQGAWEDSWSTRWNPQVFAQQGYFVVAINPTGSTTFGQEFTDAIAGDWGGKPFEDLRKGWKYVLDNYKEIDPERAVAAGASWGGYAINWIQGHPEFGFNFKALVCHDGVFDTVYNGFATDELYFFNHDFGGPPWDARSRKTAEKFNPANFVSRWSTPQLIIHGSKDYRLAETEGLGAFNALQSRGVPSRIVIFPDENHWVLRPGNSLKWHYEPLEMEQVSPTTPSFEPNDIIGRIDYSQPISVLLRTSTVRAHDAVQNSDSAAKLLRGELPRDEYIYFMMLLWKIYSLIEDGLEQYSTNSVLAPTYRPALLGRASRLSSDISYLMDTTEDGWRSSPLYLSLVSDPPTGLREYVEHLENLNESTSEMDHAKLLSHAYVRYMGDLSGGQSIRNKMVKAYGLPETGAGASFFDFGSLDGSSGNGEKRASQADLLRIKEWYRAGMNEGVGNDVALKALLIDEANIAFELNRGLFQDVSIASEPANTSDHISKSKVVFDASAHPEEEKTYP
ncbi:hypothetical protein FRC07_011302, partial [Ceratobasidium sp. 392]